jgi:hypothetical protein
MESVYTFQPKRPGGDKMVTNEDQLNLFRIIADNLNSDLACYAFGGNAMMFYGYKNDTKDIDLLFKDEKGRNDFISAITKMGFEKSDPIKIYIPEKLRDKNRPLMFLRGDIRLDLFAGRIFRTQLSPKMEEDIFALHEFKGKRTLKVYVMRKEHIVQLKAITERDKDFEDILTILRREKNFDWQYLVDEAVWQHEHGDSWMLLDLEKTMKGLLKYILIEQKYFRQVYGAQGKKG